MWRSHEKINFKKMLGELIKSKTRLRLLIKFFVSQANKGHLNGLATERWVSLQMEYEKSLTI